MHYHPLIYTEQSDIFNCPLQQSLRDPISVWVLFEVKAIGQSGLGVPTNSKIQMIPILFKCLESGACILPLVIKCINSYCNCDRKMASTKQCYLNTM